MELRTAVLLPCECSMQSQPRNPHCSCLLVPSCVLFKALGILKEVLEVPTGSALAFKSPESDFGPK